MKECKDCIHYGVCGYHITEETDMSVEECANGFEDKSDMVKVVRCKDCKYSRESKELVDIYDCILFRDMRGGLDFCNYGEKKEQV